MQMTGETIGLALQSHVMMLSTNDVEDVLCCDGELDDGQRLEGREGRSYVPEEGSVLGVHVGNGETSQVPQLLKRSDEHGGRFGERRQHPPRYERGVEVEMDVAEERRALGDDFEEVRVVAAVEESHRQIIGHFQLGDGLVEDAVQIGVEELDELLAVGHELDVAGQRRRGVFVEAEEEFLADVVVDDAHQRPGEMVADDGHHVLDAAAVRIVTDDGRVGNGFNPAGSAGG